MNIPSSIPGFWGVGSVEVADNSPGEGKPRRLAITAGNDELISRPLASIRTICDAIDHAARTHTDRPAVGWRDTIRVHEEETTITRVADGKEVQEVKKWTFYELSDPKYLSYREFHAAIHETGRGLAHLGLAEGEVFNVYSQTCLNWQLIAHGCLSISATIATAYDTLSEDGLRYSLNEPNCVGIFTNSHLLPILSRVLSDTPSVRYVVFDGEPDQSIFAAFPSHLRILSITDLRTLGRQNHSNALPTRTPKSETLACIMYTSGSTGPPKGVCITHANMVATLGSASIIFGHHLTPTSGHSYLGYLPLAHVLEFLVELCVIFLGVTIDYSNPKTLLDTSVRNCVGDLKAFRPTLLFGVPVVFETIRKGILAKVNAGSAVKRKAFAWAIKAKSLNIPWLSSLADRTVLGAVKTATGGNLQLMLSGGAAISHDTQTFMGLALAPMLQGYGLTETCGLITVLPTELEQAGVAGLPVASAEVKLVDFPEGGYFSTNVPPQGEVCVRGPSVTKGYYKRPDLNSDENIFTKDGWFKTGDIAQWNPDGTLSIIDRIKNLVKLANGEYIALERLESLYKSCNLVGNICVHASPHGNQAIAIIVPHPGHLQALVDSSPEVGAPMSPAETCNHPWIRSRILEACHDVARRYGLNKAETLLAVIITPDEWTPQTGLVTAAQKIQRGKIAQRFSEEIKAAYGIAS